MSDRFPVGFDPQRTLDNLQHLIRLTASRLEGHESSMLCEFRTEYRLMAAELGLIKDPSTLNPTS